MTAPNRAQKLAEDAAAAAELRAYQTHPDVVALRIERVRLQVERMCWCGIVLGLAFTMTNVQAFASAGTRPWSLPWLAAWLLDPTVSLVLLAILRAEQVTARYQVRTGPWVRRAKWFTLAATYVMNTWASYAAGSASAVVLHSVPPLVVFVAVEAITDLRDKLTEAVTAAYTEALTGAHERRQRRVQPDGQETRQRKLFGEYVAEAHAAWSPGVVITPAWVRQVTACSRGLSSKVARTLAAELGQGGGGHEPLPVHPPSREVERADPVLDAELVDDSPQPLSQRRLWERLASWWLRSPRVPNYLKNRAQAVQAGKDLLVAILRSPLRYLGAVVRGLVAAVRWWRHWVTVRDYRDAAELAEKLADKFVEIRALTLFRWKVTGAVAVAVAAAVLVVELVFGARALWMLGGCVSVALALLGRRKDGSPGRKAVLAGPRSLTWTMDPQVLVDAFRDAKLIGKDETLRLVERATRVGDGWAITIDLPATRKAADVIKNREALASALAVDEVQLIVERVRGNGGHAGRVAMWVADQDPYASPPVRTPLLAVECWDAWRPVPFGRDARNRRVDLPLVWTSLLVGAIPRQGKTFATRLAAAGLILDPYTRLHVADFKAGKDRDAAAAVAHRFMSGDESDHVLILVGWLVELVSEVQGRYRRMRELDNATCPESKVTPSMSRDPAVNMPITAIFIDEVQVPLEDRTPVTVQGKKLTAGEYVGELLTWLAKKGPAAGIVLVLATQRPDSKTIPSGLRAVLGSRFALRVMDWRDSNIVLGEQMNTRGYDSSRLLASHKGVGILRPDGDTQVGAEVLALTVRTYYMPNEDWQTLCQRGRALREAAGTLTGHAAGQDTTPVLDHAAAVKAIGAGTEPSRADWSSTELPEPLASVVDYLGEDLDSYGREFVPTAELVEVLDVEPSAFARQMSELGCRPTRNRIPTDDGGGRRVRGYFTADIRAAIERAATDENGSVTDAGTDHS